MRGGLEVESKARVDLPFCQPLVGKTPVCDIAKEKSIDAGYFYDVNLYFPRDEAKSVVPVGVGGIGRDTVENFLKNYQTSDAYVITAIPAPMERDISILPCLTCGSFSRSIQVSLKSVLSQTDFKIAS